MSSPSTAPEPIPQRSSFPDFEKTVKALAAFTVSLYALGLLVSNEYLVTLGISDFSSLRPRFVLTGAWVFVLYMFSSMPGSLPALYMYHFKRPLREAPFRIIGFLLLGIVAGIVFNLGCGSLFVHYISLWRPTITQSASSFWSLDWLEQVAWWLAPAALPWLALVLLSAKMTRVRRFIVSGLFLISVLAFTYDMAHAAYPIIPEAYGGGEPVNVRLYFNKDGARLWKNLDGLTCTCSTPESTISAPVLIAYQNERELVIITLLTHTDSKSTPPVKVVTVNRSLLDGIVLTETPDIGIEFEKKE